MEKLLKRLDMIGEQLWIRFADDKYADARMLCAEDRGLCPDRPGLATASCTAESHMLVCISQKRLLLDVWRAKINLHTRHLR